MKIKNILAATVLALASVVAISGSVSAVACPAGSRRGEAETIAACNIEEDNSLWSTVSNIINVILGVLGVVAVLVIILGGITYTTSAGEPGKLKQAKDRILYGIIGLVIALLAFAIVNFVLSGISGSSSGGDSLSDQGYPSSTNS